MARFRSTYFSQELLPMDNYKRAWEFFTEELRRQDLIRHGKFIEFAKNRGKNASDKHVLFPIPQGEIDRNLNLQQNPGY